MAYQRVPIDPNAPLKPGKTYEIVAAHKGGDVSRVTRADLERALRAKYGPGVRVLDWGKRGNDLVVQLKVESTPSAKTGASSAYYPGEDIYPAFLPPFSIPLALTAASVIAILYLIWRITAEMKEAVELVPKEARAAAVTGVGLGAGALGLAALGTVVLSLFSGFGRREGGDKTTKTSGGSKQKGGSGGGEQD